MKKLIRQPALFFCMTVLLFSMACRKQISTDDDKNTLANKVNAWLDAQKVTTSKDQSGRIAMLKNELDFSRLRIEVILPDKDLIIVPVKSGFKSINNKDKNPGTVLLLKADKQGKIVEGNIVQYIPAQVQTGKNIPANTFCKIFDAEKIGTDGQFSFLSVNDKFLYEIKYKDGEMFSLAIAKQGKSAVSNRPPADPIGPSPVCIDWYLVTTYFYEDGSTSQTEEYLYTTCETGGGGGSSGTENLYVESRTKDWVVSSNTSLWVVMSSEKFEGVRTNETIGGHFTGASHVGSSIINSVPAPFAFTWQQFAAATSLFNEYLAQCTISGKVTSSNGIDTYINPPVKNWAFSQIF